MRFNKPSFTPLRVVIALGFMGLFFAQLLGYDVPKQAIVPFLLFSVVLGVVDARHDFRRMRPRQRMRMLALMSVVVCCVFILMMGATWSDAEEDMRQDMIYFGVLIALAAVGAVWSFRRWRRLRAEAEQRLWQLRTARRKRAKIDR